jgi:branched-chain amino acid transport system substrate-binding protein
MLTLIRLSAILVSAAVLGAAGVPANAQEPIKIGVLLPLTGPFAKNGLENWEAMQIARDMINERGGALQYGKSVLNNDSSQLD